MNRWVGMGRLCRDVETKEVSGTKIARYTLAVDRPKRKGSNSDQTADFISCVAFGKNADFAEKYLKKGTKILVSGSVHTSNYTKKDGTKVYQTDIWVQEHEFAESRSSASNNAPSATNNAPASNNAPDPFAGFEAAGAPEELPFA